MDESRAGFQGQMLLNEASQMFENFVFESCQKFRNCFPKKVKIETAKIGKHVKKHTQDTKPMRS